MVSEGEGIFQTYAKTDEQKAMEARLEQKLAQASDPAQQFAQKNSEEEATAAAEKAKADKFAADKLAFEKLKAEEAAKAEKLAAEQKEKREKMEGDRVAFEKMRVEQEELQAREEEAAAAALGSAAQVMPTR